MYDTKISKISVVYQFEICNLYRIKFALKLGARKLKEILKLPGQSIGGALEVFFMNTLNRNGKGLRADIDVPVPAFGTGKSEEPVLVGDCDGYYGGLEYVQLYRNHAMPLVAHPSSPSTPFDSVAHSSSPLIQFDGVAHSSSPFIQFDGVAHSSYSSIAFDDVAYSSSPLIPFDDVAHSSFSSIPYDADFLALQYWYMYYYRSANIYAQSHAFSPPNAPPPPPPPPPPTFGLEDIGKSRGTGTYIPDLTQSTYWNVRARGFKPRRFSHGNNGHGNDQNNNNNESPKSSERKKIEEVLPETNMDDNSNNNNSESFELSNEDFPILETIGNTSSSTFKKSEQDHNSAPLIDLSLGTKDQKGDSSVSYSQGAAPVVPKTNMDDNNYSNNSKSFELSNEYFPILQSIGNTSFSSSKKSKQDQNSASLTELSLGTKDQKRGSSVSSSQGAAPVVPKTNMVDNNNNNFKSFELSNEYFPILQSIGNTSFLTSKKSEQHQNSASLTELRLETKVQKGDSSVSSSQGAAVVVPSLAVEAKGKCTRIKEKMN
ncbi:nucleotidyltransferase domain protein [Trifolium pratense]|uniref:Nucleotidyltransferase domain protein n=1 Tax=Trifolium pratense TaxID=57577 RepID=A0A2K3MRE9_TRIPR|nr:nucleotidyltransferase domain protein [Trifolium pratense]